MFILAATRMCTYKNTRMHYKFMFDSTAITRVARFVPNVFVHFTGFEGEYLVYLTEKRVKWASMRRCKDGGGSYCSRIMFAL